LINNKFKSLYNTNSFFKLLQTKIIILKKYIKIT